MIEAFIVLKGGEIRGHNLVTLAKDANLGRRLHTNVRTQVKASIDEASAIWRNLFRYSSAVDMDRMGRELGVRFEVGGRQTKYSSLGDDGLRLWSERLYNLASIIVQEGRILWQSKQS